MNNQFNNRNYNISIIQTISYIVTNLFLRFCLCFRTVAVDFVTSFVFILPNTLGIQHTQPRPDE